MVTTVSTQTSQQIFQCHRTVQDILINKKPSSDLTEKKYNPWTKINSSSPEKEKQ